MDWFEKLGIISLLISGGTSIVLGFTLFYLSLAEIGIEAIVQASLSILLVIAGIRVVAIAIDSSK